MESYRIRHCNQFKRMQTRFVSDTTVDRVQEDSSAPEGSQDFLVPLASLAVRVLRDLRATEVPLVNQALLVKLVQGDQ